MLQSANAMALTGTECCCSVAQWHAVAETKFSRRARGPGPEPSAAAQGRAVEVWPAGASWSHEFGHPLFHSHEGDPQESGGDVAILINPHHGDPRKAGVKPLLVLSPLLGDP